MYKAAYSSVQVSKGLDANSSQHEASVVIRAMELPQTAFVICTETALHRVVRQKIDCFLLLPVQASASEAPAERRRRLKIEAILPTDPGQDGIAIGLDGHIYSDTAITDAVAQVGQLGPLNPKVAICHFPPQERAQFQVCCCIPIWLV